MTDRSKSLTIGHLVTAGAATTGLQGLDYNVGISAGTVGATGIHMQLVTIPPGARAKAHRHRTHETAIYALTGTSAVWHGPRFEQHTIVPPGSFFYIPADVPHLPYNPSLLEPVTAVIARTDPNEQESVVLMPELEALASPVLQPRAIPFFGTTAAILVGGEATDDRWSLLRLEMPPGSTTPPHLHRREEETVAVFQGGLHVEVGGHQFTLRAGDVATLPRDVPHRLSNRSTAPCHSLVLCTPAGFDRFVRAVGDHPTTDPAAEAERAGIAFLDEAALRETRIASPAAVQRPFEPPLHWLGTEIEIQTPRGNPDDPCFVRQTFLPGASVPLHSEPAAHVFTVVQGTIELYATSSGGWTTVAAPGAVAVPAEDPHALRNTSDAPAVLLRVTPERAAVSLRQPDQPAEDFRLVNETEFART